MARHWRIMGHKSRFWFWWDIVQWDPWRLRNCLHWTELQNTQLLALLKKGRMERHNFQVRDLVVTCQAPSPLYSMIVQLVYMTSPHTVQTGPRHSTITPVTQGDPSLRFLTMTDCPTKYSWHRAWASICLHYWRFTAAAGPEWRMSNQVWLCLWETVMKATHV